MPKPKLQRISMTQLSGPAYKRMKAAGGRPALAKKVTADLDSDDDLLARMKNAKYLEKDIAKRLQEEGRISYNPKTIGTRWSRLKKVMQEKQDELLDAELTDWHEEDDDTLCQAVKNADRDVRKATEAAQAKRWRIVADEMKLIKPVTNFSHNACRNRYEAIMAGTAKPTPESISNPNEQQIASIKRRRDKEWKINEDRKTGTVGAFKTENIEKNG